MNHKDQILLKVSVWVVGDKTVNNYKKIPLGIVN